MLPPVCHPERVRIRVIRKGTLYGALLSAFLGLFLWPISSSRSTIEREIPPVTLPPANNPELFQKHLEEDFRRELKNTHQTMKAFLGDLDITQDELLDFTTLEQIAEGFTYHKVQASFFLESYSRRDEIWKKFKKHETQFLGKPFHVSPSRPMPHTIIFSVTVLGLPTHEILFYFPAPLPEAKRKPRVALIIDDLGSGWSEMERLVNLDEPVTLAILPHTPFALPGARLARRKGKSVLLHLPMQPENYEKINSDDFLTVDMDAQAIRKALESQSELLSYCVGVNNHMGSRFTRDVGAMKQVLAYLKPKHLFFLDSRTSNATIGFQEARNLGLPTAMRDVFLDHDPHPKAISRQFEVLRRIARKKGQVIAIGHPHPQTLRILQQEIQALKAEGFELVPITALLTPRR